MAEDGKYDTIIAEEELEKPLTLSDVHKVEKPKVVKKLTKQLSEDNIKKINELLDEVGKNVQAVITQRQNRNNLQTAIALIKEIRNIIK